MILNEKLDETLMNDAIARAESDWKYLHEIPEMTFEEYRTTAYIESVCRDYPVREIDLGMSTGKVYLLDAGCDETVALRADIDAVPTEDGAIHLCGHDAHTATLLGALRYLSSTRLPYNVLFIFQPGEEGTEGARAMLDHGIWSHARKPIRIFGIHNRPEIPVGDVVVHEGPLMSEKTVFKIRLVGKSGHGSLPHKCVDPIVAAAALVQGLHTVVGRNVDPFESAICTINSISSGTTASSAPESATITGFIRSFNHEIHTRMEERLETLARGIAEAYECTSELDILCRIPAVNNSHEMYEIAREAVSSVIGKEHIVDSEPSLATEDFAVWGTEVPSFLYWVGSGTPGADNPPWHDKSFTMDSSYLRTAIPVLCASAIADYQEELD